MRPENRAAVPPLRRANAALPRPPGMLLNPRLAPAAGHLPPGLGGMRPLPPIALIDDHRLMHQGMVHRHGENRVIHRNAVDDFAPLVDYRKFHNAVLKILGKPA